MKPNKAVGLFIGGVIMSGYELRDSLANKVAKGATGHPRAGFESVAFVHCVLVSRKRYAKAKACQCSFHLEQ